MRTAAVPLVLALVATGCAIGPSLKGFEPAHQAGGARVTVTLQSVSMAGELLAVEDTAIFLALRIPEVPGSGATHPLVRVPLRAIRMITGGRTARGTLSPANRESFRILSRYPGGVNADLERRLLAAYGADSVAWLR